MTPAEADRVRRTAQRRLGDRPLPAHLTADGRVKLSAAYLIEGAGFHRGFVLGRAGLSSRHVLAVVNRGGATAAEILELATRVQDAVVRTFGIELTPEPVMVGFGGGTAA